MEPKPQNTTYGDWWRVSCPYCNKDIETYFRFQKNIVSEVMVCPHCNKVVRMHYDIYVKVQAETCDVEIIPR